MKKVYIGMSGGVDSSVAALLLKQKGYDVTGFTFDVWQNVAKSGIESAKNVCEKLGIKHETVDLKSIFKEKVIDGFIKEYELARTPNPCILCNKYIKFGAMLEYIKGKADYIATGHYASVIFDETTGRYHFERSADDKKDQTYMFHTLTQEQISKIIMPLGGYKKEEVRKIAAENGFDCASSADSQDICFLEGKSLEEFFAEEAPHILKKGNIVNKNGDILGHHSGCVKYTIGQRKGLGVASTGKIYVVEIDGKTNTVVLDGEKYIFSDTLIASDVNFHTIEKPEMPIRAQAKIRYAAKPADCTIYPEDNGCAKLVFDVPQRAITPGQSVVFYDGNILLGGGIIEKAIFEE